MEYFREKTIWISGASSGIGKAICNVLANIPCRIAISARSADKLSELAKSLLEKPAEIKVVPCDITQPESVKAAYNEVKESWSAPSIAILSAGTHTPSDPLNFSADEYNHIMNVNYNGTINCLQECLPPMLEAGNGHIACVSSIVGYRGLPAAAAYCASKAALIAFCESMRFHTQPKGVNISIVNPGFVKTPLTDKNEFEMPFVIDSEEAAQTICEGLAAQKKEIHFPKKLSIPAKILRVLPYPLYEWLIKNSMWRNNGKKT